MDIKDSQVGDIYVDALGKLWRITNGVKEPIIMAEEVESTLYDPQAPIIPTFHTAAINSMLQILTFILLSFPKFLGSVFLILAIGMAISFIVRAFGGH